MAGDSVKSAIIGIAGGPFSGKTQLCEQLLERLKSSAPSTFSKLIHLTSFLYPNSVDRYALSSYDIEAFKKVLSLISQGAEKICLPDGSCIKLPVDQNRIILIEGYYLLLPELLPYYTSKIFVYEDADTRLERCVLQRVKAEKGDLTKVLNDFVTLSKPAYDSSIHPTRENADIILPQKENIDTALLFVSQHLQDILAEMNKTSSSNTVKYDTQHETYMKLAHEMARTSLSNREVPVSCVFVYKGEVIGRGFNETNCSLSGIRHAELIAIEKILEHYPASVFKETTLYVTVEPCLMCAAALKQLHIKAVYFGCGNDRFGGCGSVFSINKDQSIDPSYPVYPGLFYSEAVMLMREFYVQENVKAPVPQSKKQRVLKREVKSLDLSRFK
ncbi:tRNA specific adenosine-34 deaminase subunit Tad2 [Schizosaccharomyces pombe]|uniref:tRNA-specific adenosine-34 deaminase catalytic subunit tad2 n=2 Tax=Schizosaccharomyces pombe (strain 972 / ATCC 24843) TaxID=284812 RepID=ADAT2_SCHPO